MRGLLVKDFKLMKMQKNYFVMIIAIAFIVSLCSKNSTFMLGFITYITSMFTISTISYDEFDNGNAFLFTLPISRKRYALEKYVFGILLGAGSLVFAAILSAILGAVRGDATLHDVLLITCVIFPFVLLLLAIMIPFQLKFGSEKGRIAIALALGIVFGISVVIGKFIGMLGIDIVVVINHISTIGVGGIVLGMMLFSAVLVLLSMKISISIMNKKEF